MPGRIIITRAVLPLGFLLALVAAAGSFAAPRTSLFGLQDVLDCVALNQPYGDFSQLADIRVRGNSGQQRQMQARILGRRGENSLQLNLRLRSPGDVAGTATLIRERSNKPGDIHLYLPALERIRYISDAMAGTRLFDTDFSYADLKQLYGVFIHGPADYLGIEKWHGRNVHQLRIQPRGNAVQPYTALITRVDTASCVILGMDFLDAELQPQRQMRADPDSIIEIDGYRIAQQYSMRDLAQGSRTTIRLRDMQLGGKIPAFKFSKNAFFRDALEPEPEPEPAFTATPQTPATPE